MMTKIHWHIEQATDSYYVRNNADDRLYKCYDLADAAWLVGVLNKLETGK